MHSLLLRYCSEMIYTHDNTEMRERKKERHLRQMKNEKMSCLRWDSNPRHSALRTDALTN